MIIFLCFEYISLFRFNYGLITHANRPFSISKFCRQVIADEQLLGALDINTVQDLMSQNCNHVKYPDGDVCRIHLTHTL